MRCYLSVDVGTSSVRAGLFTEEDGKLLSTAVNTISISNRQPDHYEQSTENIWEAVCITVKALNTNGTWLIRGEDTNNFTGTLGNHMALLRLFYPEKQIVGFDYTPPTQPQTKRETSSLEMHLSKFRSSKTGLSDCMHTPEHYYPDTFQYSVLSVGYNGGEIFLKDAVARACIRKEDVCGIGFDATCSLVVLDSECHPLSVNASGDSYWNVIMWMDHRAAGQVERINTTNHDVLKFVGGKMSPEMQLPKLLWLKENLKETCWNKAGHFFDLPDFLTWRATGSFSRSLCSLVCKWSYQVYSNKKGSWNDEFFRMANLSDLLADNYAKIGNDVRFPGVPCGSGLSSFGSAALGLCPGTPVGTSIIDAHAGGLGSMACVPTRQVLPELVYRMALICGTSSCHMTVSSDPTFVPGVWGPYFSAMIPGLWLNEGGQSATGKLLDHIVHTHPAFPGLRASAGEKKQHSFEFLNDMLSQLAAQGSVPSLAHLTSNIHVWPDFHGNRSPLADPTLRGMISGMTLSSTVEDLALLYLATVQAVAYGTKHILKEMEKHGYHIQVVCVCGGLRKNPLFVQTHADVTGLPLLLPDTQESVLLGAAILGAYATGNFSSIQSLMKKMGGSGRIVQPIPSDASYHDKKYGVFLKMLAHQREYQNLMKS